MKKRFIFIIGILMAVLICFIGAMDCKAGYVFHSGTDGSIEWSIENKNVDSNDYYRTVLTIKAIEGSDGKMMDFDDPYHDCPGTIHPGWAYKTVNYIEIEEGVVYIGECAFYSDASNMFVYQDLLKIPDTVTGIGAGAFCGNKYIKNVEIPDSVKSIGEGAFSHFTVIICNSGSYAEKYAKENDYNYKLKDVKIKLNKTSVTTTKGKTLNIKVLNKKTNKTYGGIVDTQISNPDVLKIKEDGSIEIIGYGKSTIKYTAGKSTAKCTIYSKPLKAKIKAAKSYSKKSVKVKWNAVNDYGVKGFQILISQDKNFKKGVRKIYVYNISRYSFSENDYVYPDNYTITGLKSKKLYYIKMRAYANSGTSKVWGSYSKTLKVRIK